MACGVPRAEKVGGSTQLTPALIQILLELSVSREVAVVLNRNELNCQ